MNSNGKKCSVGYYSESDEHRVGSDSHLDCDSGVSMAKKEEKKDKVSIDTPGGGSWVIDVPERDRKVVTVRLYDHKGRERMISYIPAPKIPLMARIWRAIAKWMNAAFK